MNNLPVKKHLFKTLWFEKANFMNSSLGIRLPIFSIHGNHDDPVGLDLISSLDQASANHYVNYFGKIKNLENLEVTPVLF
jgi:double-strand break repair protein MRE11